MKIEDMYDRISGISNVLPDGEEEVPELQSRYLDVILDGKPQRLWGNEKSIASLRQYAQNASNNN